jgi:hypothetical protein
MQESSQSSCMYQTIALRVARFSDTSVAEIRAEREV